MDRHRKNIVRAATVRYVSNRTTMATEAVLGIRIQESEEFLCTHELITLVPNYF